MSALSKAAFSGHLKVVKLLVEMGNADVSEDGYDDVRWCTCEWRGAGGRACPDNACPLLGHPLCQAHTTPLMEACVAGHFKVVKYLCAKGADMDIVRVRWSEAVL